ncbi:MAG: hypothetical protein PHT32_03545 [Candidatus Omnitrophica bacterium]|nr:hypothetical protein [Candidatus Omnitrophota bacterium]
MVYFNKMDTKRKLRVAREVMFFSASLGIAAIIFGVGDVIKNPTTKKLGVFIGLFSYIFYSMFRVSVWWFGKCNRYPLGRDAGDGRS